MKAQELEHGLKAAADFRPGNFCSAVLHTVLGLIAATGVGASQVLRLDRQDVMPRSSPGTILIRERSSMRRGLFLSMTRRPSNSASMPGTASCLGLVCTRLPSLFFNQRRRLSDQAVAKRFSSLVRRIGLRARNRSTLLMNGMSISF